ncbi:MAG TPA: metallophosphoesterase [Terricaulis sp.]|nr:metallophosphoesterase [Terricaulis sp.]
MMSLLRSAIAALAACFVFAAPSAQAQSTFENVERVVAIGDLEGAYEKYLDMLRTAGLIDAEGNWIGGRAHLVQLGDIPDRGPNSRAIMDHLMRIERQARRAGGRVHALIGNHEAMNVEGDLRYVHPGEYAAFATRNSARVREQYYQQVVRHLRANPPAGGAPSFDAAWRTQWETEHPLGWVEHRRAWSPTGTYGRWIISHQAVLRINDTLFLHGGLGPSFVPFERDAMNRGVQGALRLRPVAGMEDIVTNQEGPLWYRGLARNDEATETANLEAVLARHGVARIVVGHTKLAPLVIPRFGGRVLVADIAVPRNHSDPHAFVVIENGAASTIHRGQRVPINAATPEERCAYFGAVAALEPAGSPVAELAAACETPLVGADD